MREQIARRQYENHVEQIESSKALEEFMRTKFTNEDLYTWMQGELAQTYYDCYKLAFDVAKRAGFTLVKSEAHTSFGKKLVGQTWELKLVSGTTLRGETPSAETRT